MSPRAKWEYVKAIHSRYRKASRRDKKVILDEFCRTYRCHRKHAIRLLNSRTAEAERPPRRGRPKIYVGRAMTILGAVWEASGYLWSARLKAAMPLWLPSIRKRFRISPSEEQKLLSISSAQIDRTLKDKKALIRKTIYGTTKPGTLLKQHIPVQTEVWSVKEPGYTEIDLVSHSGSCSEGRFGYTLDLTDIHTTWVERRCVLGKGQEGVCRALDDIRRELPFELKGIDSDNGSEFINDHLYRYCREPEEDRPKLRFTRGREYKKDDNAHIEQKNWTHVRKVLGYGRFDTEAAVAAINDLYRNELRWLQNLFQPSVKLVKKVRIGARLKRIYDKPKTPFDRVLACAGADAARIAELKALRDRCDPFQLSEIVDVKVRRILSMVSRPPKLVLSRRGRIHHYQTTPIEGPPHFTELESPVPKYERLLQRDQFLQTN